MSVAGGAGDHLADLRPRAPAGRCRSRAGATPADTLRPSPEAPQDRASRPHSTGFIPRRRMLRGESLPADLEAIDGWHAAFSETAADGPRR